MEKILFSNFVWLLFCEECYRQCMDGYSPILDFSVVVSAYSQLEKFLISVVRQLVGSFLLSIQQLSKTLPI